MKTIKGPGVFLAQFAGDEAPFNTLVNIAPWGVNAQERQTWAVQQLHWAAKASWRMGLTAHATFSGALAWPFFYPWPQRPAGLMEEAFAELGRRWLPILNAFDEAGGEAGFGLNPGG